MSEQIKKFVDRITLAESRQSREITLLVSDAKLLRDEILKILLDQRDNNRKQEVIEVVMKGGNFK
jgi:hypothetical protein